MQNTRRVSSENGIAERVEQCGLESWLMVGLHIMAAQSSILGLITTGVKGAIKGAGKGLFNAVARPVKGAGLAGYSVISGLPGLNHEQPKCFSTPHTK